MHDLGFLPEARELYERALKKQPRHAGAYYLLGMLAMQEGKSNEALAHWNRAASLDSDNPDLYSNLSAMLLNCARYKEAEEQATRCLALRAGHKQALYNLGSALLGQKKYEKAYAVLHQAVEANPDHPDNHVAFANASVKTGRIEQAMDHFRKALLLAPDHEAALFSRTKAQAAFLPMEARGDVYAAFLNSPHSKAIFHVSVLHKLAIHFWVARDRENTKKCIDLIRATPIPSDPRFDKTHKIIMSFIHFLSLLLDMPPKVGSENVSSRAPNGKIFLIGDSHCLSYSGEVVSVGGEDRLVVPFYIDGAKAWHFGNGENAERNCILRAALCARPEGASCWLTFGEIDCRIDEGIQTVKNEGTSLEAIARETAVSYVRHTAALLRDHGVHPVYLNVPAPRISLLRDKYPDLTDQHFENHIKTVAWFNAALRDAATNEKCGLVDLYGLTSGPDGTADGRLHIDGFHLLPKALGMAALYGP